MATTTIIGVDYSGAKREGKTWLAQGHLTGGGALVINNVQPISRSNLYNLLAGIRPPAVTAMDFPFGVPAVLSTTFRPTTRRAICARFGKSSPP